MRLTTLSLFTTLSILGIGCSRAEAGDGQASHPTPLGAVERIDRIQFLGNASSALTRAEDAHHHGKDPNPSLRETLRLVGLAHHSAAAGDEPVEAEWESKTERALTELQQGLDAKDEAKAANGLELAKLYIDQAQQAASIEY